MLHASYGPSLRALGCVQMQENLFGSLEVLTELYTNCMDSCVMTTSSVTYMYSSGGWGGGSTVSTFRVEDIDVGEIFYECFLYFSSR